MSEAALWKKIKDGMTGRWSAIRIENSVGTGFPDVDFGIAKGRSGKIELKYLPAAPKRPMTKVRIHHFTKEQKLFFRMRGAWSGDVWLLVQVDQEFFIFDWKMALCVEERILSEWREIAKGYWKGSIDYGVMANILLGGC